MLPSKITYDLPFDAPSSVVRKETIESGFIGTLQGLKCEYRPDITNRATLEQMIMRPYQVYAGQRKVKCIDDDDGNGFVWHTTGRDKTLTSFKAATLWRQNANSTLAA